MENIEEMARAYNERLRGGGDALVTEAVDILLEQKRILDGLSMQRDVRLLSYVASLKEKSLEALETLDGSLKIPSYRLGRGAQGGVGRWRDLEIDLFITLDKLQAEGRNVAAVIDNEVRATALFASFR